MLNIEIKETVLEAEPVQREITDLEKTECEPVDECSTPGPVAQHEDLPPSDGTYHIICGEHEND